MLRIGQQRIVVRFLVEEEILPIRKKPRPALAPAQAPNPWAPQSFLRVGGRSGRSVKLTNHLRLLPCLRMSGALPPVQHIPSWRAQWYLYRTNG